MSHALLRWLRAILSVGLPRLLSGEESACSAEAAGDWVRSLGQEDPLEAGMATHSSILAWRIHGQRSLASYST